MSSPAFRSHSNLLPVRNYDLDATLDSGQVFHFERGSAGWEGIVGRDWVRLAGDRDVIRISHVARVDRTARVPAGSGGLKKGVEMSGLPEQVVEFLQARVDLARIEASFPQDGVMERAVQACRGLRLLKQDPWQCLASFILSSTKQICQIRQICSVLCRRFGPEVEAGSDAVLRHAFPSAEAIARLTETDLRQCKAGFRAPYLLGAARKVAEGKLALSGLAGMPVDEARAQLMGLRGVGRKIADCVLLFTGSHACAFPVDVWVARALRELYFDGREVPLRDLQRFAAEHFGPHGGYAQQYLFHYVRVHGLKEAGQEAAKG